MMDKPNDDLIPMSCTRAEAETIYGGDTLAICRTLRHIAKRALASEPVERLCKDCEHRDRPLERQPCNSCYAALGKPKWTARDTPAPAVNPDCNDCTLNGTRCFEPPTSDCGRGKPLFRAKGPAPMPLAEMSAAELAECAEWQTPKGKAARRELVTRAGRLAESEPMLREMVGAIAEYSTNEKTFVQTLKDSGVDLAKIAAAGGEKLGGGAK